MVTEPAGVAGDAAAPKAPIAPIPTVPVVPATFKLMVSWLSTAPMVAPPFQPVAVNAMACVLAAAPRAPVFKVDEEPVPASVSVPAPVKPDAVKFLAPVAVKLLSAVKVEDVKVTDSEAVMVMSVAFAAVITPEKAPFASRVTLLASPAEKVLVAGTLVNLATAMFKDAALDAVTSRLLASLVTDVTVSAAMVAKLTAPVVSLEMTGPSACAPFAEMLSAPAPALTMVKLPPKVSTVKLATSVDLDIDRMMAPAEFATTRFSKPVIVGW